MTAPAVPSIAAQIKEKLRALDPERLELMDESGQHVGHAGAAGGGGHYRLTIVSPRFVGVARLVRHRLIYAALGELMHHHIHALAIEAYSPDEL